jgi:hypothetical protein
MSYIEDAKGRKEKQYENSGTLTASHASLSIVKEFIELKPDRITLKEQ